MTPIRWLFIALMGSPLLANGAEGSFSLHEAKPYFSEGSAAAAATHLRLEEFTAAEKEFERYARHHSGANDINQARFLWAYAALKAGHWAVAARLFDGLVATYPLLADYHRTWAARAFLMSKEANEALARAKKVPSSSALDGEARLIVADAERLRGEPKLAAAAYHAYLDAYPASWRSHEVRLRLAESLYAAHESRDAEAAYRQVYLEAPAEPWGKQAESHLSDSARLFAAPELAERAMALFDNMRNVESETAWKQVLEAEKLTPELDCTAKFHIAQSVFKQRDRLRAAPLFDVAVAACTAAKHDELTTKALYQGGRAWGTKGEKDPESTRRAAALFERVWREHPSHSYADDARLREAECYEALKDDAKVFELLAGLPDAFPTGDQRGEALWRLAFRAFRRGDYAEARKWLEQELTLLPREDGWWEAGRTLYWLGRVDLETDKREQGFVHFERAIKEYPLSYYALMAFARLRALEPGRASALADALFRDAAGDPRGFRFGPRTLFSDPGFRRGLELVRLGLGAEAKREFGKLGISAPNKKGEPVGTAAQEELLWLTAALYDRAGEFALSHSIPRHVLTRWASSWPTGEERKRWLLAYPRAFAELIEKHAGLNGQPAALEFAIMREESAFDPLMESFANAVGLTQLTAAPAARFAGGLPHDRAALRNPVINITIGARELGHLWKLFAQNAPFAIAGYNAGEGAVNRWRKDPERAHLQLDAWIEAIPYDETRGYTKRVLASYFTYAWLYGTGAPVDRIPAIPLELP